MYSILSFLDSPTIREYNQNTEFTPIEQVVLIVKSCKTTVEEKISAMQELLDTYSEKEFLFGSVTTGFEEWTSAKFRDVVKKTIQLWKQTLEAIRLKENAIYAVSFREKAFPDNGEKQYFSDYEKAFHFMQEEKQSYLEDEDLKDVETFAYIERIELDTQLTDRYDFDNFLRLVRLFPNEKRYEAVGMNGADNISGSCYVYVPVPFRKGDIVRVDNVFLETYYGVIPEDMTEPITVNFRRDGTDMNLWLDVYVPEQGNFDYANDTQILDLSYDIDDIPPKVLDMLEKLTGRIKPEDSLDIYSLIRSEEIREYYRNKVELSAEVKESIITCCYQSLHKKWKLLQMLAAQLEGEEQRKVEEMAALHEWMAKVFYYPALCYADSDAFYAVNKLAFDNTPDFTGSQAKLCDEYIVETVYFSSINEVKKYLDSCTEEHILYTVDVVIKPIREKSWQPIRYVVAKIDGAVEPIQCYVDMDFEGEIEWKEALDRYQSDTLHVDLPFEHGCRVKVQLPMMTEPVYGVLWRKLDGNQNKYNFYIRME